MQVPFSAESQKIRLFPISAEWECAFDFHNPRGVALVRKHDAPMLESL